MANEKIPDNVISFEQAREKFAEKVVSIEDIRTANSIEETDEFTDPMMTDEFIEAALAVTDAKPQDSPLFDEVPLFSGDVEGIRVRNASPDKLANIINRALNRSGHPFLVASVASTAYPIIEVAMKHASIGKMLIDTSDLPESVPSQVMLVIEFFDGMRPPSIHVFETNATAIEDACEKMGLTCSMFSASSHVSNMKAITKQNKLFRLASRISVFALVVAVVTSMLSIAFCDTVIPMIISLFLCIIYQGNPLGALIATDEGSSLSIVPIMQLKLMSKNKLHDVDARRRARICRRRVAMRKLPEVAYLAAVAGVIVANSLLVCFSLL